MTLRELANQAVDKDDPKLAGALQEELRNRGFDYESVVQFVQRSRPNVTKYDWEDLMIRAEDLEALS